MKYKFIIMTNFTTELEIEIKKFNIEKNTDLKFLRILDDEVTFVELETSISMMRPICDATFFKI